MEEVVSAFACTKSVVASTDAYEIVILKLAAPRSFMILSLQTKRNCKQHEIEEVFGAMVDFIKKTLVSQPCYYILDISKTDAISLGQLKHAAFMLHSVRQELETRLVGTVLKVDEDTYQDSYLASMFQKLYTPVRPICWWRAPGDAVGFIREWEHKMNA